MDGEAPRVAHHGKLVAFGSSARGDEPIERLLHVLDHESDVQIHRWYPGILGHGHFGAVEHLQHGPATTLGRANLKADELGMVNVWTPLVPATVENGCMQFIPGTHKLGVVPHAQKNKFYLEIAEEYLQPRLAEAINVELDPGDVVLFSNLLFHRGLPNRSGKIRWSSDWRYQDARQSTLHTEQGHIARSRSSPGRTVRDAQQWAELSFV